MTTKATVHSHSEVDYEAVPNQSTWGNEEQETLTALESLSPKGRWINLGAGDGRFNAHLLKLGLEVIASDNDQRAIDKLARLTPPEFAHKLTVLNLDITQPFPFHDSELQGCFCTATLHIFDAPTVQFIISEMVRVVGSCGKILIDFRTDIERRLPDGGLYRLPGETSYSTEAGRTLLERSFAGHPVKMLQYPRPKCPTNQGAIHYVFQSQCLLATCEIAK